jgi:hypothetical protein
MTPPASFLANSDTASGSYAYAIRADSLTTNLLSRQLGHECAGPGSYSWLESDGRLTFEEVEDTCRERETILTSQAWTRDDD